MTSKRSGTLTQFNKLLDELCEIIRAQARPEHMTFQNLIELQNKEQVLKMELRQLVRTMK